MTGSTISHALFFKDRRNELQRALRGRARISVVVTRRRNPAIHRGIARERPSLIGARTMAAKKKAAKKKAAKKPAKKAAKKK